MHTSVSVTKDQRVKPNVHTFYDHTKGGVDVVDLVSTHNTTKMKNRRWPINALAFVLDIVCTSAKLSLLNRLTQLHYRRSNSLTLCESY